LKNEDSFYCAFQAIGSQWIEEALFDTEKASVRRKCYVTTNRLADYYDLFDEMYIQ
jgi:hypothetical protein